MPEQLASDEVRRDYGEGTDDSLQVQHHVVVASSHLMEDCEEGWVARYTRGILEEGGIEQVERDIVVTDRVTEEPSRVVRFPSGWCAKPARLQPPLPTERR